MNIPAWTSSPTSSCSNTPFQRGRQYKAQHRLPSLAPYGTPFCATPGKDLLPQEPRWVVQESKGASPLAQHPLRNSRHKHTATDGGQGREGRKQQKSLFVSRFDGSTGVSPRTADLPLKPAAACETWPTPQLTPAGSGGGSRTSIYPAQGLLSDQ